MNYRNIHQSIRYLKKKLNSTAVIPNPYGIVGVLDLFLIPNIFNFIKYGNSL